MRLVLNYFLNMFWWKSKKLDHVLKSLINGGGSDECFLVEELGYNAAHGPHVYSVGVVPFVL